MTAGRWLGAPSYVAPGVAIGRATMAVSTIVTGSGRGAPDAPHAWGIRVPRS